MLLPDQVIDQITSDVWNMTSPSEGEMNLFPPNITSAPLGKVDVIFNNRYDRIRMPIPEFTSGPGTSLTLYLQVVRHTTLIPTTTVKSTMSLLKRVV